MTLLRLLAFAPIAAGAANAPPTAAPATRAAPVKVAPLSSSPSSVSVASAPVVAQSAPAPVASAPAVDAAPVAPQFERFNPAKAALDAARAAANKGTRNSGRPAAVAAPEPEQIAVVDKPVVTAAPTPVQQPEMRAPAPWERDLEPESTPAGMPASTGHAPWEATAQHMGAASMEQDAVAVMEALEVVEKPAAPAVLATEAEVVPQIDVAPIPEPTLGWDGRWPELAASLTSIRGVAHQLALQSEFIRYDGHEAGGCFYLRVPFQTLCSPASIEKLVSALCEHFGKTIRVETEIGAVSYTASVKAGIAREESLKQAEQILLADPYVQTMMREFDATIVEGTINPLA